MQKRRMLTIGLCGLMAVGLCFFAVNHAQAASGNGPYYAEPSWSQKLPAATRFVVLTDWNNEAVLDRETGLVWERSPATPRQNWRDARRECPHLNTGNRLGWRLPSAHELGSLIDRSVDSSRSLPPGHPFANIQSTYWSATTVPDDPTIAWEASFSIAEVATDAKTRSYHVWCVRGGNNADAY